MAVDSFTRSILMKDLVAMQKNPLPFAWMPDDVLIDDNILAWQLWLVGPEGTQLCVAPSLTRTFRGRPRPFLHGESFPSNATRCLARVLAARAALQRHTRAQPRVLSFSLCSEGGVYKILLTFPPSYPNEPPEMRFATPLWHPNSE